MQERMGGRVTVCRLTPVVTNIMYGGGVGGRVTVTVYRLTPVVTNVWSEVVGRVWEVSLNGVRSTVSRSD